MKVWVVTEQWDYENNDVRHVFDSEQKAMDICAIENAKLPPEWRTSWRYVEMEIK